MMPGLPRLLGVVVLAGAGLAGRADAQTPAKLPHAWLFGTWTGGLFPAPTEETAQSCLAAPVVIFARDVVLRASLVDTTLEQRTIVTARTEGNRTEFRFAPEPPQAPLVPGGAPIQSAGFGCGDPDVLHVLRKSDSEISFPGCGDFPNPLLRCPSK